MSRASEIPQRASSRLETPSLWTSSSDSDSLNHYTRLRTDKTRPNPVNQKKLGSRIADLESQHGQAQDELKRLKNQLVSGLSAESSIKAAKEKLDEKEKPKKQTKKYPQLIKIQEKHRNVAVEPKIGLDQPTDQENKHTPKPEYPLPDEIETKKDELDVLRAKLEERDKELEILCRENENMKKQVHEKLLLISWAKSEIEELTQRVSKTEQELETSKAASARLAEKVEAAEKGKEELENEMKRLHLRTEQWRKATDAAANILADERRISKRCKSMDQQHYGNMFDLANGGIGRYAGFGGGL